MKIRGSLSVRVVLPTLLFLLTACTSAPTSTQATPSVVATHTLATTNTQATPSVVATHIPGTTQHKATVSRGMTLPPQSAWLAPNTTSRVRAQPVATPIPAAPTPIPATPIPPTPTPGSPNPGAGSGNAAAAQAVFTLINQERAGAGLPAMTMSNALIQSAHKHNLAMLAAGQLSHQLPGEADLGTRITAEGVIWNSAAENIGYGFGDATQTAVSLNQSMFAEKPPNDGHRQNILSGNTIVGIDIIVNPQNSQVWLTEDFAHPA